MIYMKSVKNLLKPKKRNELYLLIVLVIYILMKVPTPERLAQLIDNVYGNAIVSVIAIALFVNTHPVVGVASLIAAYELIKRSSIKTGSHAVRNQLPSEHKKLSDFKKYNDFPVTLEEEVVSKMAPLVKHSPAPNANYKPILSDTHDAASPIDGAM